MDTIKINKKQTLMVAHRGLSGLERENSLHAFVAACNRSYYGCECDIHLTKDKKFVVCHDDHLRRVSHYDTIIPNVTFDELSKIRLKAFGEDYLDRNLMVPTLDEYLDLHKKYQKHCIIEIKCHLDDVYTQILLDRIKDMKELIIFISFDINNLIQIRKLDQDIPLQYLTSMYTDELIATLEKEKLDIDIFYQELTKERLMAFHKHKIIVNAWTVNDKNVGEELVNWGIDFITTNILE